MANAYYKRGIHLKSIKTKITVAIVVCSLICAATISFLSISNSRNLSNADAQKELVLNSENAGIRINALISRIEQSVDTLTDIAVERLDFTKFQNNNVYVTSYTDGLLEDFLNFLSIRMVPLLPISVIIRILRSLHRVYFLQEMILQRHLKV